jgi:Mrp family chromosome partitioning ATPase
VQEGFQAVRLLIERDGRTHRTVMVASPSSGDGKTASVVQFALSLTAAGQRVIILDLDLRKPDLSRALRVPTGPRLASVLEDPERLEGALVEAPGTPLLRVFSPEHDSNPILIEELGARLPGVLSEARSLADYVLIDTAPLGEVSDGLRIATHVDDILLVVRMGNTRYARLEVASEMLGQLGSHPTGIVVIGGGPKIARGHAYPRSSPVEGGHRFPGGDDHRTSNAKKPAAKENRAPYQRRERTASRTRPSDDTSS